MRATIMGPVFVAMLTATSHATTASGSGMMVEVNYPPSEKPGELAYGVTYLAWLPEGVTRLRGVIVHQHGCGAGACKGGETAAADLHWQALARKWDCALLGPSYHQEDGQPCQKWSDPRLGSRARFLQALGDLAAKSGHPELATVPWCLWGHSGGGAWVSRMIVSDPGRVVAAWLRSGTALGRVGGDPKAREFPDVVYRIPVVCNSGAKEKDDARFRAAWDAPLAMVRAFRAQGAPVAFAPDPRTGHECGDSRYPAIPFFDACLAARLPDRGSDSSTLRPVDLARGWLAPVLCTEAVPAAGYRSDPAGAVWLPGERVARAWQEYVRTGAVGDRTAPPAPTGVRVATTGHQVTITWDAAADLESGLRQFVIRRDGREFGRVPEKPVGMFGRPLFQTMSYHDTPERPWPALRFVHEGAGPAKGAEYRVIAVNGVGMESEPSQAARVP